MLDYYHEYLFRRNTNLKLVLLGGGDITIPRALKEHVIDLGFVPIQDKYDAYAAAELLCQPSKHESFSYVIMESWLCERPVLVHKDCNVTQNFAAASNGGLFLRIILSSRVPSTILWSILRRRHASWRCRAKNM